MKTLDGFTDNALQTLIDYPWPGNVRQLKNVVERLVICSTTRLSHVEGFVGNFKTKIADATSSEVIEHGVAILATGANESRPDEYLYGEHDRVVTHLEMDALLRTNDHRLHNTANIVFIQCVGSRDERRPYCSKVCCTHTIKRALDLKKQNSDVNIFVLYRDIRTYGQRESLYLEHAKKELFSAATR